jgi:hypothetical protein
MNKDKVITFEGSLREIEEKYNRWTDSYDNIEILESIYIPVEEVTEIVETGKLGRNKHIKQTTITKYNKVVHYMATDETHLKRVYAGTGVI